MIYTIKHFSIYLGLTVGIAVLALSCGYPLVGLSSLTLITVFVSFLLSSVIVYGPKNQQATKRTQRFILATSLQFLITLFYVLFLFWKSKITFRSEALFLVGVFFAFLMIQLILFIRSIQKQEA